MSRKMPKSLHSWLIPKLRRASMYWLGKTIARDRAKIYIQEGEYRNGKPKMVRYFLCATPDCGMLCKENEGQMDHIVPVIELTGFTNWDDYINSLFCSPDNYQHLCNTCHDIKTHKENVERFKNKMYKKLDK
jgi:5-methylcytosine-specific restriction endonuclease McrA